MPDHLKPATEWHEAQGQSYEQLRQEATEKRLKRENLQPMGMGKGRYANIFKVGDRTRSELALSLKRPSDEQIGSGEIDLEALVPPQALKDLADAFAGANVTALAEAQEGVREQITYDKDEAEQLEWTGHPQRHLLQPHAQERMGQVPEAAAFDPLEENDERNP